MGNPHQNLIDKVNNNLICAPIGLTIGTPGNNYRGKKAETKEQLLRILTAYPNETITIYGPDKYISLFGFSSGTFWTSPGVQDDCQ